MKVPMLAVEAFHEVIRAFKNELLYVDKEQAEFFQKQNGFIPVSGYSEWIVVAGEIGILDDMRLILKKENEGITGKPDET